MITAQEIVLDQPVFDAAAQLVGVVKERKGRKLTLRRPSGYEWSTVDLRVRPANDRELLQLRRLQWHHAEACRLVELHKRMRGCGSPSQK